MNKKVSIARRIANTAKNAEEAIRLARRTRNPRESGGLTDREFRFSDNSLLLVIPRNNFYKAMYEYE